MAGRLFTQTELFGTLMRAGVELVVYEQLPEWIKPILLIV